MNIIRASFLTALVACGSKAPPATTSTPPTVAPATGSADACTTVGGTCVSQAEGANCRTTSADECAQGQVCCTR